MTSIAFFGTPHISAKVLQSIHDAGHQISVVVTQPDKRRTRQGAASPSPVKATATALGLKVIDDLSLVDPDSFDIGVVAAYGRIIPASMTENKVLLNIHPSLLPRWRGATPVESAILAGDTETGVCVMRLVAAMDAGPIYGVCRSPIEQQETSEHLLGRLFEAGTEMLLEMLDNGLPVPEEQSGEVTLAPKLSSDDFRIDWTKPATEILRLVRLGRAWTTHQDRRLIIKAVSASDVVEPGQLEPGQLAGSTVGTATTALSIDILQPASKAEISGADWVRGRQTREQRPERLV